MRCLRFSLCGQHERCYLYELLRFVLHVCHDSKLRVQETMRRVRGDLLELGASGRFDVIVHGCNCMHRMGKGIAHSIRTRFPESFEADKATAKGSREKLGTYSCATVLCSDDHLLTIVNAYTQYHFSPRFGPNADYEAIRAVFRLIRKGFTGKRIGYPLIGAGLAGGNWEVISQIIDEELDGEDHMLVEYDAMKH